ncbi:MAG: hypothetical protein OXS40_00060 [Gammaproteobacteria bacterium]|nr:hypothetical protein [Gammaproteobacteria bacterium]
MNAQLKIEEQEILEKFERGELRRTDDAAKETETARIAARNTVKKSRKADPQVPKRSN